MACDNINITDVELLKLKIEYENAIARKEEAIAVQEKEKTKRKLDDNDLERKRMKIQYGQLSSSTMSNRTSGTDYRNYYNTYLRDNIQLLDMNDLSKTNKYVHDKRIQSYLNDFPLGVEISENEVQEIFDNLMNNLFTILKDSTSLKYLSTCKVAWLDEKCPDCTFVYKNINVKIHSKCEYLQDFAVCVGEIKVPNVSLNDREVNGQIFNYLEKLLCIQERGKVYGFLTNVNHIRFFCVKKTSESNVYHYFRSEDLRMFDLSRVSSSSSSSVDMTKKRAKSRKKSLKNDTWTIFLNFLTMNVDFYGYTRLDINPQDDLLADKYTITKRLGSGLTSIVYLLQKSCNNHSRNYSSCCVIKVLRQDTNFEFLNEIEITKQLKQLDDSDKFHLFFQDITMLSSTGNDLYLTFS